VPCDYCGASEAGALVTAPDRAGALGGMFTVVVCRRCGLARTSPRPAPPWLAAAYPADYDPHAALAARTFRRPGGFLRWALINYRDYPLGRRAPAILRAAAWPAAALKFRGRRWIGYLPYEGTGRLLDVGCGAGRYVGRMAAAGWRAEGLDAAPRAVEAGRRAGLALHHGTLPGADLPDDAYDAITLWHSLEHVPSPMATLRAARRHLRPGGRLLIVVPRLDSLSARWFGPAWYGLELPRHLTHFTAATLGRHVAAAGFVVERLASLRRPAFIRRSLELAAADMGGGLRRALARSRAAARLLSHLARLAGRTDEVVCWARRPAASDPETRP
jgi:SAM-dependent methyltransferase